MRASRVLTFVAGTALLAACGGDNNGPSNAAPTAAFTVACSDLACTFTDGSTDSDGTVDGFAWGFGDPNSGGSNSANTSDATHTFSAAGTYSVTLTVTDNDGATNAVTKQVVVPNVPPVAGFTSACNDLDCDFANTSADPDGTIATYSWNFGDPNSGAQNTSSSKDLSHTFSAAGTFTVSLTVTDNGGASHTATTQVTVTAASANVHAEFTASCTGPSCTLTNTSTATGTVVTYAWNFGDGQTSTDKDPAPVVYDIDAPTSFTITLVVTADGVPSQASQVVHVSPGATLTCNGVDCTLGIDQDAVVVVTLTAKDCEAHGNTFVITNPTPADTLFTDGCFAPVAPAPGSSFTLNNGAAYTAGTQLAAEVLTGVAGASNPQLRVTGTFASGWTLEFDDGFVGPGEPDFNDLVITVKATPTGP